MSLQDQIDHLVQQPSGLGGLQVDRSMLGIALHLGTEGGKRFRPWLLRTVHEHFEGAWEADALAPHTLDRVGAAIEMLHTAFVVHDDVIDNDDTRRGRASVPGWFRSTTTSTSEAYPRAGAILVGDLALSAAVRGIATCGASPQVVEQLLDLLDVTLHDSAVGELADVRLSLGYHAPSMDDALSVAELKTAAYSFVLPMKAGAVLAGAPESVVDSVGEVGRNLGVAFQLRDDLLGTFGADDLGKDPDGDLREGKRTPLVVHASTTPLWRQLEPLLGDPDLTAEDADRARRLLVEAGSVDHVEGQIATHVRRARRHARALGLDEVVVDQLTGSWQFGPTAVERSWTTAGHTSHSGRSAQEAGVA